MIDYIKDMVYSPERIEPERIAEGTHKNLHYYVLNLGTHPCAYIDVTNTKLSGINYEQLPDIECHWGLTYSRDYLATVDEKGWFIGWDYAHCSDFSGYYTMLDGSLYNLKKWTTAEIVNECKAVIDQIDDMLKGGAE